VRVTSGPDKDGKFRIEECFFNGTHIPDIPRPLYVPSSAAAEEFLERTTGLASASTPPDAKHPSGREDSEINTTAGSVLKTLGAIGMALDSNQNQIAPVIELFPDSNLQDNPTSVSDHRLAA
jgi:hypothetical protein